MHLVIEWGLGMCMCVDVSRLVTNEHPQLDTQEMSFYVLLRFL